MVEGLLILIALLLALLNFQVKALDAIKRPNLNEPKEEKPILGLIERMSETYKPRVVRRSDDVLWEEEQARKG